MKPEDKRVGWGACWRTFENFWFRTADERVYGLLRMAFAVVVLLNLVDLWPHRLAFFSDGGMIDYEAVLKAGEASFRPTLFAIFDAPGWITLTMVIVALAAICLAMGWVPRWMIAIIFVWQLSYTYRGELVVHGWDVLLRIIAFVLLISPLGPPLIQWWREKGSGAVRRVPRYGLLLLQIQLAVVYWQTVWLKLVDASWRSGEFMSQFMLSIYSRFPGVAWENWQLTSATLSYAALAIEMAVPLLLWNRRTRWLGLVAGAGLHLGIAMLSHIWLFSLAVLVPYLAFLEGDDLDRWKRRWGAAKFRSQNTR